MELSASSAFDEVRRVEEEVRKARRHMGTNLLITGLAAGPFWWSQLAAPDWVRNAGYVVWIVGGIVLYAIPRKHGLRGNVAASWYTRGWIAATFLLFFVPMGVGLGLKLAGVESLNWLITVLCLVSGLPLIYAGWRFRSGR
ncbi:hypothetical protein [Herbidospora mongoliensis]|uniref:hypothetical protein n=1 Tax=Herbidospora mongoliensis TaxID=688067 RepID=UPI0008353853|nr:hypothetical protein [Herbidospora mongoliensis]